jgi:DNA-binding beta-propeller fold protein YncE
MANYSLAYLENCRSGFGSVSIAALINDQIVVPDHHVSCGDFVHKTAFFQLPISAKQATIVFKIHTTSADAAALFTDVQIHFEGAPLAAFLLSVNRTRGVAFAPNRQFFSVTDTGNHRILFVHVNTGLQIGIVGSGSPGWIDSSGTHARFNLPSSVTIDSNSTWAFVSDSANHRVRLVNISSNIVTTLAGSGFASWVDGIGASASFNNPNGIAVARSGAYLLVCDSGNNVIRSLELATRQVLTLAGSGHAQFSDGVGTLSSFFNPLGIAVDPSGAYAVVTDSGNNRIRLVTILTGLVRTLADPLGAFGAPISVPRSVAMDSTGLFALVSSGDHRIRRLVFGKVCSAGFYCPSGSSSATQVACPISAFCPSASSAPQSCTPGYFCVTTGLSAPSGLCAPGYFCANGSAFTMRGAVDGQGIAIFSLHLVELWMVSNLLCV